MMRKYNLTKGCNMKLNKKRQGGFTLIEVMAGAIITALGLLMLLPMMVTSMNANNIARSSTEVSMLMKDKMEQLKNTDNPISGYDTINGKTRVWRVTPLTSTLNQFTIDISWNDQSGRSHGYSVTSYSVKR